VLLLGAVAACAVHSLGPAKPMVAPTAPPTAPGPPGPPGAHALRRDLGNDDPATLSLIARRHGVNVDELLRLNGIADPRDLKPDRALILRELGKAGAKGGARAAASDVRVIIYKGSRELELRVRGKLVRTYRLALGGDPVRDKEVEGDSRTPEGDFFVCQRLPRGKYGPSLGLSYPNAEDAERGVRRKLITDAQRRSIVEAVDAGRKPPWNTRLGGAICVHGRGGASAGRDWTLGCIALDDDDAGELFALTPMGARVKILAKRPVRPAPPAPPAPPARPASGGASRARPPR